MKRLRYLIEYLAFLALFHLVRLLPHRLARGCGAGLGRLMPLVQPKRRKVAEKNLRLAFPDLSEAERKRLLAASFRHLGVMGIEVLCLDRFFNRAELERRVEVIGREHLDVAYALGRGVFYFSGHLGLWELGNIVLTTYGYPVDYVFKRIKNPYIDRRLRELRETQGSRGIDKSKAARKIVRALGEGHGVGILMDQRVGAREAVVIDFFGQPANTTPIIAQIAMKQQTPVVPVFVECLPNDRYLMRFDAPLFLSGEISPQSIAANTARLNACIEEAIRRAPEQWFWVHDRWKP